MGVENSSENTENRENTPLNESEALQKALEEEKQKAEDYLNNWKRAQADFINYKRNCEIEKLEVSRSAAGYVMLNVLPALDDLERALGSIPRELNGSGWIEGFRFIERKLRSNLEAQGLKPIKALGEKFDPRFHEAIKQDKGPEGIVLAEAQKGYLLHDKLLRPAKVVVGNGEASEKEEG